MLSDSAALQETSFKTNRSGIKCSMLQDVTISILVMIGPMLIRLRSNGSILRTKRDGISLAIVSIPPFYLHWGKNVRLFEYLDEVGRTAMLTCEYYRTSQFLSDCNVSPNKDQVMQSFLDFAMWFQPDLYVKIKAPLAPPNAQQHAIRYRNGLGGNVVSRNMLKYLTELYTDWLYQNMADKTIFSFANRMSFEIRASKAPMQACMEPDYNGSLFLVSSNRVLVSSSFTSLE